MLSSMRSPVLETLTISICGDVQHAGLNHINLAALERAILHPDKFPRLKTVAFRIMCNRYGMQDSNPRFCAFEESVRYHLLGLMEKNIAIKLYTVPFDDSLN